MIATADEETLHDLPLQFICAARFIGQLDLQQQLFPNVNGPVEAKVITATNSAASTRRMIAILTELN